VSEAQLKAASLSGTDVPSLQTDPSQDHTGVETLAHVADAGGMQCNVFLNAINTSKLAYHPTSYPSTANAQRVIDDTRASAKSCASLRYTLRGNSLALSNIVALSLPKLGDDSTGAQGSLSANGNPGSPVAVDMIRVGSVDLSVYAYGDPSPTALLQLVATTAAAKLGYEETVWAR
jgi:hypothetical protein